MRNGSFSWSKRVKSFSYAWNGLVVLLRDEHNARIHLVAAVVATVMGFVFDISSLEWVAIVGCIGLVIATEAMNSALEALCDRVSTERHELIGKAKDCGAAAVLVTAITALIVGLIVFVPKIIAFFAGYCCY